MDTNPLKELGYKKIYSDGVSRIYMRENMGVQNDFIHIEGNRVMKCNRYLEAIPMSTNEMKLVMQEIAHDYCLRKIYERRKKND